MSYLASCLLMMADNHQGFLRCRDGAMLEGRCTTGYFDVDQCGCSAKSPAAFAQVFATATVDRMEAATVALASVLLGRAAFVARRLEAAHKAAWRRELRGSALLRGGGSPALGWCASMPHGIRVLWLLLGACAAAAAVVGMAHCMRLWPGKAAAG